MRLLRFPLILASALAMSSCQLDLIGGDDDDNGNGGSGGLTLRILGSEGAGFNQVALSAFEVEFWHEDGRTRTFPIDQPELQLFSGSNGSLVVSDIDLPSGTYENILIRAEGNNSEIISYVDDALAGGDSQIPLEIPGEELNFQVDFSVQRGQARTVTLVVHTASSVRSRDIEGADYFTFIPSGIAVRNDRSANIQGSLPCPGNSGDDAAVYVFNAGASSPRDIRGSSSNVNEPVLSFAAEFQTLEFTSPPLPPGDWRISYTCNALDDDPDGADEQVTSELRSNIQDIELQAGQELEVVF